MTALAVDATANVYFAADNVVFRMDLNGVVTRIAGNGLLGFSGDGGAARAAQLSGIAGLAIGPDGSVYVSDAGNRRIRKVLDDKITTMAGGGAGEDGGEATSARLTRPAAIALDPAGNLYIVDGLTIRMVSNGNITTIAGNGFSGFTGDNGPASQAEFNTPGGILADVEGSLYIVDSGNSRVRRVSNGIITTIAGNGKTTAAGDNGPANEASFNAPARIARDAAGNLYITERGDIRKISNGTITTVAMVTADISPTNIAATAAGDLYIAVSQSRNIFKVSNGKLAIAAGGGSLPGFGDDGVATEVRLHSVNGITADPIGNVYFSEGSNLHKLSNGLITKIAGPAPVSSGCQDGPASTALRSPAGVALDTNGVLYFADSMCVSVSKITNGVVTRVAGSNTAGALGDNGPALAARLRTPAGIAIDGAGSLYIADSSDYRIRKVSNGVITTIAGTGEQGLGGDNIPASSSALMGPTGVAAGPSGTVFIVDGGRVRKISNGIITTIATFSGASITADPAGTLYVANSSDGRVYRFADDTLDMIVQLPSPTALEADPAGNILIASLNAPRIGDASVFQLSPAAGSCISSVSPSSVQFDPLSSTTSEVELGADGSCSWVVGKLQDWIRAGQTFGSGSSRFSLSANSVNDGTERRATISVGGLPVAVTQGTFVAPSVVISGVRNAFGTNLSIAPNTWVKITGSKLAPEGHTRIWKDADFLNGQMPIELDGVSVTVNGKNAYVYYISPTQINILTPPDPPVEGQSPVQVNNGGVKSLPYNTPVQQSSPSFFVFDGRNVVAVHADGSLVGPRSLYPGLSTPAKPGETIVLFANGFGPTTTPVVRGSSSQSGTLSPSPSVLIGSTSVNVAFAGLVAPGLFQFNVTVPTSTPNGDQPISAAVNGANTQFGVVLAVER